MIATVTVQLHVGSVFTYYRGDIDTYYRGVNKHSGTSTVSRLYILEQFWNIQDIFLRLTCYSTHQYYSDFLL